MNSTNGFVSAIFGPPLWLILHMISMNYPLDPSEKDPDNYKSFFESIGNVLPCGPCRDNFQKNLDEIEFKIEDFETRSTVAYMVFRLHNIVNKTLGKPELTFSQSLNIYEPLRARSCTENSNTTEGGCKATKPTICNINILLDTSTNIDQSRFFNLQ